MTEEKRHSSGDDEMAAIKQSFAVIGAELCSVMKTIAPTEAHEHFRSAQVEALKGLRVLIDHRIERLSAHRSKGTSIEVE